VPLEVIPVACRLVQKEIRRMGGTAKIRQSELNRVFVTDQGNLILDADFGIVNNPEELAGKLATITGVVEHGIFVEVSEVHVARIGEKGAAIEILKR
jgi:ribose 5-phosphate isomerase A